MNAVGEIDEVGDGVGGKAAGQRPHQSDRPVVGHEKGDCHDQCEEGEARFHAGKIAIKSEAEQHEPGDEGDDAELLAEAEVALGAQQRDGTRKDSAADEVGAAALFQEHAESGAEEDDERHRGQQRADTGHDGDGPGAAGARRLRDGRRLAVAVSRELEDQGGRTRDDDRGDEADAEEVSGLKTRAAFCEHQVADAGDDQHVECQHVDGEQRHVERAGACDGQNREASDGIAREDENVRTLVVQNGRQRGGEHQQRGQYGRKPERPLGRAGPLFETRKWTERRRDCEGGEPEREDAAFRLQPVRPGFDLEVKPDRRENDDDEGRPDGVAACGKRPGERQRRPDREELPRVGAGLIGLTDEGEQPADAHDAGER